MEQISILPSTYTASGLGTNGLANDRAGVLLRTVDFQDGFRTAAAEEGSAPQPADTPFSDEAGIDEVAFNAVSVELNYDKSTNRVVAIVKDRETGEVLSQFPSEAILHDARGVRELLQRQLDMRV